MPPIHDPRLEHQMQVRMLGNAWVYVTCNCLVRRWKSENLSPMRSTGGIRTTPGAKMSEEASLGDFAVGTHIDILIDAYNKHLGDT